MARPKVSAGTGVQVGSLNVSALVGAALTAFATNAGLARVWVPCKAKIIAVTLNVGSKGGTHSTSSLDVKIGSNSILAAAFDVDALTAGEAVSKDGSALVSAYAASVAADTELIISTSESGGSSPTWKDVTIQIDYLPIQ